MKLTQPFVRALILLTLVCQVALLPLLVTTTFAAALPLVDDFENGLPSGLDGTIGIGFSTFQDPNSTVAITTTNAPPAPVPGATTPNNVLKMNVNVVSFAGFTHGFENAAVNQWVTQDWSAYAGLSFWLYGNNSNTTLFIDVLDNRNPSSTKDDAERWSVDLKDDFSGWREIQIPFTNLRRKEIGNGAPNDGLGLTEVHGWAFGTITTASPQVYYLDNVTLYGTAPVRPLTLGFSTINYPVTEGNGANITVKLSKPATTTVTVDYASKFGAAIVDRDYTAVAGTLTFPPNSTQQSFTVPTFNDAKYQGERGVLVELSNPTGGAAMGLPPVARVNILDNESYDPTLLDDFESYPYQWAANANATLTNPEIAKAAPQALPGQGDYERVLTVTPVNNQASYAFSRTFPLAQDWSASSGLRFWFYGQNSGQAIKVKVSNNQAAATNPAQWQLLWSDEFNSATGTPPNPKVWGHEVGDGTVNGIPGWGNDELEYYTNSTDNAATDGNGNLVITTKAADGSLQCYYGPCQYTSARLLTKNRFEVAYGRIEARVKVAQGAGLWPAFWMLGTDIDRVGWPQTGEIDIMEYVGRLPNEIFGTIHGPGYSGGQSYGQSYDLGQLVANNYHTFTVEWEPNKIVWYLNGNVYHQATPNDAFLQGKQWVFNHPFFMLLNVAVGGNFGGAVGPNTTFPQTTLVDYVRIYGTPPQPVAFTATFPDNFTGWQLITLPLAAFQGAAGQTPDLTAIHSLGFEVPGGVAAPVMLDQVQLSCANTITVTNVADSGAGTLRSALGNVCAGGTIQAAASLAGQTITLTSGPLTLGKNVTIDGSAASGLTISGNNSDRVLVVNSGVTATMRGLTLANGYGYELAGGVLNNGVLTLERVVLADNRVTTGGVDFWKGGGGIYNGDGSTLTLVESTVRNNSVTGGAGGGVYGFFNTTVTIERSTIYSNTANDVGGGIRSLGNFTIRNSTISGNSSTGWQGGAFFHTDGVMNIINSTIANNRAPADTTGGGFVGTFTASNATLTLVNTIVTGNSGTQCFYAPWGAGTVTLTSLGHNLVADGSCGIPAPNGSDLIGVNAKLGPLTNNGGPTLTHALQNSSPARNAAAAPSCPASDQRNVTRPQGAGCDIGAYEAVQTPGRALINIIVDAQPDSDTNLGFTGTLRGFLLDDPAVDDGDAYTNTRTFSVAPGSYTVQRNNSSAWRTSAIGCTPQSGATIDLAQRRVTLTVAAGADVTCTFTVVRGVTITARTFNDLVRNGSNLGKRNALDWWLENVTMTVATAPTATVASTVTQPTATPNLYSAIFRSLPPGSYTVCTTLLASNWVPTTPTALDPAYGKPCKTVTLQAGQSAVLLFGAYKPTVVASADGTVEDELITDEDRISDQPADPAEDETVMDEVSLPRLFLPLIQQ
jgi:beta-glucanase (GH16 family)